MISKISFKLLRLRQARLFATVIKNVPGDKPPVREENVEGRYAGVLFSIASKNQELDAVNADMEFLAQLMKNVSRISDERVQSSRAS